MRRRCGLGASAAYSDARKQSQTAADWHAGLLGREGGGQVAPPPASALRSTLGCVTGGAWGRGGKAAPVRRLWFASKGGPRQGQQRAARGRRVQDRRRVGLPTLRVAARPCAGVGAGRHVAGRAPATGGAQRGGAHQPLRTHADWQRRDACLHRTTDPGGVASACGQRPWGRGLARQAARRSERAASCRGGSGSGGSGRARHWRRGARAVRRACRGGNQRREALGREAGAAAARLRRLVAALVEG